MEHESLRPYVTTGDELYRALQKLQTYTTKQLGGRALACLACLAVGLAFPGPIGSTALCLAAMAAIAAVVSASDYAARNALMDLVTLHDLIRPRDPTADYLLELLTRLGEGTPRPSEETPDPVGSSAPCPYPRRGVPSSAF